MRYPKRAVPPYTRDVALVTSNFCGSHSSEPRKAWNRYSFTPASALANVPFSSRPPLNKWNTPVKSPSPFNRQRSLVKKISRMRGKCTRDLTCHVCSGQRPRSTLPVACERDPSASSCNWLNRAMPASIVKREVMSVRMGR